MMLAHFHADTGVPKGREVREGGGGGSTPAES